MGAHLQKAAIVLPVLADKHRLHRCLHVVVDAACAGALEEGKRPLVGVEHHLLRLARAGANEHHAAVAQANVRDRHRHRDAAHQDDFVAPVELVGLTRRERQRHIRLGRLSGVLPAPKPGIAANCGVAAVVAQPSPLLEEANERQPFARPALGVLRQQLVQLRLPMPDLGTRLNLPLIRERRPARPQHLANRVARHLQVTRDLLDRLAPDEVLASDPADRLHNQHPPPPTSN